MTTTLIYDPQFLHHDPGLNHPENPRRLTVILNALQSDQKLWQSLRHVTPVSATINDILRCHTAQMIDDVKAYFKLGPYYYIDPDTVVGTNSYDIALLAAGAGIVAVDELYLHKSNIEEQMRNDLVAYEGSHGIDVN